MGALNTLTPDPRAPLVSRRRVLADLYIRAMSIRAGAARLVELEIARRLTKTTQRKLKRVSLSVVAASFCAFLHPRQLWIVACTICMCVACVAGTACQKSILSPSLPGRPWPCLENSRISGFHGGDGGPIPVVS